MKVFIVLAALVCYAYAQTTGATPDLKQELIDRATRLQERVKTEVQKLVDEKREHLSTLLKEEGDRVDKLITQLKAATDPIQLAILESDLIDAEYRVNNEVSVLERETETQELLLAAAAALAQYVKQEIAKLEAVTGENRERAQEAIRFLNREEENVETLTKRLVAAENQREIEIVEVELRAAEIRIAETLRELDRLGTTAAPGTTPAATTRAPTTPAATTHAPTTPAGTTRAY